MDTAPKENDAKLFQEIRHALGPWMTRRLFLQYLAWEQAHHGRLSPRQHKALDNLLDQLQSLAKQPWVAMTEDIPTTLLEERDAWYDDLRDVIKACYRAGLGDHPLIALWITLARGFGDKKWLRSVKRGLETGVKRPYSMEDLAFMTHFRQLRKSRKKPSLHWIHLEMRTLGFYRYTWQAFKKRCDSLNLSVPLEAE